MKIRIMSAMLTAIIAAVSMSFPAYAEYKTVQMTVAPENMLNVQVTDSAGNVLEGVTATMTDTSGAEVVRWTTGDEYSDHSDTGINLYSKDPDSSCHFTEPLESFTYLADGYTIDDFDDYTDGGTLAGEFITDVWFTSGQKRTLTLLAYDPNLAADQTLTSNVLGMYVDSRWANRQATSYFVLDGVTYYLNKTTSILGGSPIGKLNLYFYNQIFNEDGSITSDPNFTGFTEKYFGVDYGSLSCRSNFSKLFSFDYDAHEYIKYRAHITDLDWAGKSFDTWDNSTGTFTVEDNVYSLASDPSYIEGQNCTTATLQIISGTIVSAPIPDENGYIEFYVDRATRRYNAHITGACRKQYTSGSIGEIYMDDYALFEFAGYNYSIEVSAVTLPYTGDTLINVPAGSYTLSFTGGALGSNTQFIPVTVSQSQDVQYMTVTLDPEYIKGDVNGDDAVNISDATIMLTHYAQTAAGLPLSLTDTQLKAGDTDGDSSITISDATAILRYYAEKAAGLDPAW